MALVSKGFHFFSCRLLLLCKSGCAWPWSRFVMDNEHFMEVNLLHKYGKSDKCPQKDCFQSVKKFLSFSVAAFLPWLVHPWARGGGFRPGLFSQQNSELSASTQMWEFLLLFMIKLKLTFERLAVLLLKRPFLKLGLIVSYWGSQIEVCWGQMICAWKKLHNTIVKASPYKAGQ